MKNSTNLCQDTAKTTFDASAKESRIDLNRAGVALMEIVSEPDMRFVGSIQIEHLLSKFAVLLKKLANIYAPCKLC